MNNIRFDFSTKTALITGGAQGIGFEIARQFLQSGAQVEIWDYSIDALKRAEDELKNEKVYLRQVDVTNRESCQRATEQLSAPLDILVNNAGITRDKSFRKMTGADFDAVIQTNLTGLFNVTHALLEKFNGQHQNRRIINMASVVALYGNFGQTNYVAAKAGVVGLTKTWGKEMGRKGFTVNAIAPGFILTDMTRAMPDDVLKGLSEKVPVARLGTVQDIAQACLFLASDEAAYINGTVLSVDGGIVL